MTIVTFRGMPGIPAYTNPLLQPGLAALSAWLEDRHYSQHARERVLAHAAIEGTPTGSSYLEPEDEEGATEALVAGLDAVSDDSPAWQDPAVYLDVESLMEPRGAVSIAPPGPVPAPSAPTRRPWSIEADREADRRRLEADPELAAILRDEPELARMYADCLPAETPLTGLLRTLRIRGAAPVCGGAPNSDDPDADPMSFPRRKDASDRRADMAQVAEFYRLHPDSESSA